MTTVCGLSDHLDDLIEFFLGECDAFRGLNGEFQFQMVADGTVVGRSREEFREVVHALSRVVEAKAALSTLHLRPLRGRLARPDLGRHGGLGVGEKGSGGQQVRLSDLRHMSFRDRIIDLRRVKAGSLAPSPANWRRHPPAQREALRTVLGSVGYADAVIARETPDGLMLVDGHLRADLDPEQMIPVLVTDLDEAEAGQVMLTLDPLAAMAQPDVEALESLVSGLASSMDEAMRDLMASMHDLPVSESQNDPDEVVEPPSEPVSVRGGVWLLGRHRLMCGDSTDEADVVRLLDGGKPRLMVTDPPYGVNYNPSWRDEKLLYAGQRTGPVPNDDSPDWSVALLPYRGCQVAYVWSPGGDHQIIFANILIAGGFEIRNQLVWRKQKLVISRGHYHWQHESCWYGVRKGKTAGWVGDRSQTTIWDISWDKNVEGGHSTQKPVECMERPIRNHEGDVYDPFLGSGTTIVAAERQGRTCYGMEIEPRYVDASVARFEAYTGEKAVRA